MQALLYLRYLLSDILVEHLGGGVGGGGGEGGGGEAVGVGAPHLGIGQG